jgi:HEAT repeat protein
MALTDRSELKNAVGELFQTQRAARRIAEEIATAPSETLLDVLAEATSDARAQSSEEERVLELQAIAQILGQIEGPKAIDALIDILGSEEPAARQAAGIVIEETAFERFKEVALGVERALAHLPADHLALSELPYLLMEIPEPGVSKLLGRFLEHKNPEVVAAAIEATVEMGDTSSAAKLAKLEKDTRLVELDEEEHEGHDHGTSVTIGDLAKEARLMLEAMGSEDGP